MTPAGGAAFSAHAIPTDAPLSARTSPQYSVRRPPKRHRGRAEVRKRTTGTAAGLRRPGGPEDRLVEDCLCRALLPPSPPLFVAGRLGSPVEHGRCRTLTV